MWDQCWPGSCHPTALTDRGHVLQDVDAPRLAELELLQPVPVLVPPMKEHLHQHACFVKERHLIQDLMLQS